MNTKFVRFIKRIAAAGWDYVQDCELTWTVIGGIIGTAIAYGVDYTIGISMHYLHIWRAYTSEDIMMHGAVIMAVSFVGLTVSCMIFNLSTWLREQWKQT
mgnify:CR=1 FL=1